MELYEQYFKTIDNQIAFAWATDDLEVIHLDTDYKMLKDSELGQAQRAPVEAYVNMYLKKTIIAYRIEQTGVRTIQCDDSKVIDLETMTCKDSHDLTACGTAVAQCAYFQIENVCVKNCTPYGYLNPVSGPFSADRNQ